MNMKVREQVKSLLGARGITMKEISRMLCEKMDKKYSLANLSSKLARGTLTYNEVLLIADFLNYKIVFEDMS